MGLFDIFNSKKEDSHKHYLKELIAVAKADGHLEKREYDLILSIANKLACSPEEVKALSLQEESGYSDKTTNRSHRLKLLFDTVAIMMIDGDIDPKEVALCKSIAMKSGFEHEVIDDIVYRIRLLTKSGKSIEEASKQAFEVYNRA